MAALLLCNCSATYIWMLIIKFHQKCNKNSISLVVICCFWFGFGFWYCELNLFGSALVSSFISSSSFSSSSNHKSTRKTRIFLQIHAHYVLKVKFENRNWRKKISSREIVRARRNVFNRIQYGTQNVLCLHSSISYKKKAHQIINGNFKIGILCARWFFFFLLFCRLASTSIYCSKPSTRFFQFELQLYLIGRCSDHIKISELNRLYIMHS